MQGLAELGGQHLATGIEVTAALRVARRFEQARAHGFKVAFKLVGRKDSRRTMAGEVARQVRIARRHAGDRRSRVCRRVHGGSGAGCQQQRGGAWGQQSKSSQAGLSRRNTWA